MEKYTSNFIRVMCVLFVVISIPSCMSYNILVSINNCSDDVYKLKFKLNCTINDNSEFYIASFKSVKDIDYNTLNWKKIAWEENVINSGFYELDLNPGETIRLSSGSKTMDNYESRNFDYVEITNLETNAKMTIESKMLRNILQIRQTGFTETVTIPGLGKRTYAFLNLN